MDPNNFFYKENQYSLVIFLLSIDLFGSFIIQTFPTWLKQFSMHVHFGPCLAFIIQIKRKIPLQPFTFGLVEMDCRPFINWSRVGSPRPRGFLQTFVMRSVCWRKARGQSTQCYCWKKHSFPAGKVQTIPQQLMILMS